MIVGFTGGPFDGLSFPAKTTAPGDIAELPFNQRVLCAVAGQPCDEDSPMRVAVYTKERQPIPSLAAYRFLRTRVPTAAELPQCESWCRAFCEVSLTR